MMTRFFVASENVAETQFFTYSPIYLGRGLMALVTATDEDEVY